MGKAIGIDLGTTNSVVAYKDTSVKIVQTGANNEDLCRSCVAIDKYGQFLVGNAVFKNWKKYTPNIVVSVKRLMGAGFSDEQVQRMINDKKAYPFGIKKPSGGTEDAVAVLLQGKEYTPEQISAEILKTLKNDANTKLGGDVTHAVITVPAYFTEKQKSATQKAAEMAGIRVQRLLAEPTAAAISYGFDKMQPRETKHIIVYDFGGGTFDLSILMACDGQFIESGSGGDRWLGGDDIDRRLSEYICSKVEERDGFNLEKLLDCKSEKEKAAFFAGLKAGIEDAKKLLSQVEKATIYFSDFLENEEEEPVEDFTIERSDFENLIRPIIKRTIDLVDELLKKTNIDEETIDNILLVGGSSCIPLVRKMLEQRYGIEKIKSSEKPMLAVAEGAAILAQSLPSEEEALSPSTEEEQAMVITTTKHQTFIRLESGFEKIIDSQEPLPLIKSRNFHTTVENQKIVEVEMYNDVENGQMQKITTGFFTISDNLPANSELRFTFNLDENELLSAKVKVTNTAKEINIRLGRGYKDSKCLVELSQKIDDLLQNNQVSSSKKATFIADIQSIIEDINKNNYSDNDSRWDEIGQRTLSVYSRAMMGEKQEDRIGEIFALILLNEFRRFINDKDAKQLIDGINRIKDSKNDFEKDSIRQELMKTANNYQLLINVYFFKLISENADTPQIAGRASCAYDEMKNALNNNNISEVLELITQNSDLLEEITKGQINIGTGTGIG